MTISCPNCGAMLVLVGGFGLIRLKDGGLAIIGVLKDHDCSNVEENYVMNP